ncbi:MAG: DUF3097 domain-containing protein [Sporichthyaceae bacterium]
MRSELPGDRLSGDALARNWRRPRMVPQVQADRELVVEEVETGFCGAVLACEKGPGGHLVTLVDRHQARRVFPLGPGFLIDGRPVVLIPPAGTEPKAPPRNPSGSIAAPRSRARVARASRIYVEGRHDAELVERVWGADLREVGVVVEYLAGIDELPALVAEFAPAPGARLGVLVDHLVPGSKEARLAAQVTSPHTLVVGHPYVDIWQAVKPAVVGIAAWPPVPRGRPWKEGVIAALGWDCEPYQAWRRILSRVNTWTDLEPDLLGRVEELIDFVSDGSE